MSVPRSLRFVFPLLVLLLVAGSSWASFPMQPAGQLAHGIPHDVVVSGGYAYVAAQGAVSIYNISTPANPVRVATVDTPGSAEGVAKYGDYLYVADWDAGLRIIKVTTPAAPEEVGAFDTAGYAYGVAVWEAASKTYACVADHAAGVRIINVTTPSAPTSEASYDTPGYAWNVEVYGDYLYVADGFAGLLVLNVTNPAAPSEVGSCSATNRVFDVAVTADYVYLADGTAGLRVVDVTDPSNPVAPFGCAYGAETSEEAEGTAFGVFVVGEVAYLAAGTAGLRVVDIADPTNPDPIDSYDTPGRAHAVAVSQAAAYVADDSGGLRVIDVSPQPALTIVGQAATDGNAEGIAATDDVAYVADGSGGLLAFDVLDATEPLELWSCTTGISQAMDVDIEGDYAYVADWGNGLVVVDKSGAGCTIGSVATGGHPSGIAISGNRAYVAAGEVGLVCCDITTPSTPAVLWTVDTPGAANDVALSDDHAYVADGSTGLQIVDIVTPSPAVVASESTSGYSFGIDYATDVGPGSADYVFLASGDAGLDAINVNNPLAPSKDDTLALAGSAHSVSVYQQYAYVSVGGHGVAVVDISDPADLTFVTSCGTPSVPGPSDLVVAGGYAYVADAESGLVVVDLLPPYTELASRQSPAAGERLDVAGQNDGSALTYVASRLAGLQIVQVSDADEAANPALIRTAQGFGDVTDVSVADAYAYVTDINGRLSVVNLSNPTNPSLVGHTETAGSALGVDSCAIGLAKYALVADGDRGVSVISTQFPSSPTEAGTFNTPGWCADVVSATLAGDVFACAADGESGLRLINLSPIGQPPVMLFSDGFEDDIAGWTIGGTAERYTGSPRRGTASCRLRDNGSIKRTISTVGYGDITISYYLAADIDDATDAVKAEWYDGSTWHPLGLIQDGDSLEDGLLHQYSHDLDAASEENPAFAVRFSLTSTDTGDVAYVDDVVVNSASSSEPTEAGFYNTIGQARGLALTGDYACVADGDGGLRVIDISAPGHPTEVGALLTDGYAESVETLDRIAVVADGDGGVLVIDVSTPTSPVELAYYETPGWASDVDILEGHAYVTDSGWGLTILRLWHSFKDVLFSHWAFSEIEAAADDTVKVVKGYPDGLYHPTIKCSRDQMCVFIARAKGWIDPDDPMDTAGDLFIDVLAEYWAGTAIQACLANDVVMGYSDNRFRPTRVVARDEMTVFISRAEGWVSIDEPMDTEDQLFIDVWESFWCGKAIKACMDHGVVKGYPDGFYRPYLAVTREQMAVFVYRAFSDEWPLWP